MSVTAGGAETRLVSRPEGVVDELWRDGERLLDVEYRGDGRVVSMERGDAGEPNTVRYAYDERGFRTAAEYGGRVSSTMGYDVAGNLVRYELATTQRTVLSQDYEIGDYNEVVRIRTGEGPDVSFGYDSAGRMTSAQAGPRTAAVAYDDLDRAVRVELDGEVVASYAYARADADAALEADRLTSGTPVPRGGSAVFGTMESVVYTHPTPMDFGPVVYEPALRTFVATHRHLVPDAVLASSLDRRMLPWRGGEVDGRPFGIDKPSNSLFVPPEYRSVNCFVCTASLESASVTVPVAPMAGEAFDVLLGAGGTCIIDEGGPQGAGFGAPVGPMWHHSVAFGDGGSTTGAGGFATVQHTYDSRGAYDIRDDVSCSPCNSVFTLGYGSLRISVCKIRAVTSYADVESCPRLLQSDADYDINGCTAAPDIVNGVVFGTVQNRIPVGSEGTVENYPCNQHDLCYETCASNRGNCDDSFEAHMLQECGTDEICERTARSRARSVRIVGWYAFRREQKEHCLCCD